MSESGGTDATEVYDLAIVGGGVNGCGIARDAAGRGLRVLLLEQDDLASGTSSWSTKLIHGGLRYLEHYEFRLVREALIEREVLWSVAPHLVRPLRFVLPHHAGLRPAWLLRAGLGIYDHLGGRKRLPPTRTLDLARDDAGRPLRPEFARGFEYSDCSVDDTRLVALNARDAADRGATIRIRTRVTGASRENGVWRLEAEARAPTPGGAAERLPPMRARALVNAAGPWVARVLGTTGAGASANALPNARSKVRLVQGSHIVVRRLFPHERAYIFQNADGRIVFAIPYEDDFTLIGTTDRDYDGDPKDVVATPEEIAYLCEAVSGYLREPVRPEDVVWTFSGVRPLYDDGATAAQEATRDYVLELDAPAGAPPLLSVFGGKITTYRRLAEAALARLEPHLPRGGRGRTAGWTGREPLPGGAFAPDGLDALTAAIAAEHAFLTPAHARRLVRAYGTAARDILAGAGRMSDLGRDFGLASGVPFTEAELAHLATREWAQTAQDVAWRRSKLGLRLRPEEIAAIEAWLRARDGARRDAA